MKSPHPFLTKLSKSIFEQDDQSPIDLYLDYYGHEEKSTERRYEDHIEERQDYSEALENISQSFWTEEHSKLKNQLNAMNVTHYPDLNKRKNTLKSLLESREAFLALSELPKMSKSFLKQCQDMLILPPNKILQRKQQLSQEYLSKRKNAQIIQTAKLIRKKLPDLYSMHQDWFDIFYQYKKNKKVAVMNQGEDEGPSIFFNWWLWIIVLLVIKWIILMVGS